MATITRILANLPLTQPSGYLLAHFGQYASRIASGPAGKGWQQQNERRSLKEILAAIPAAEKPDILLIRSPEYLPLPDDIASFTGPKILLITDWNVGLRYLAPVCSLFDCCYTDFTGASLLRKAGAGNVFHAPFYGHDAGKWPELGWERDIDLSFCGNLNTAMHRERNRVLARLIPARRRYRLHLTQAFGPAYQHILGRSRLVFNHSIRGEANMRLYEAMASGAVPFIEKGNAETPLLFREGEHYFTYDPENPLAALEACLNEPERLRAMAESAREAVREHAAEKQLMRIANHAVETLGKAGGSASVARAPGRESLNALRQMRVLGTGFTIREALDEIQAYASADPELRLMTFPGLLLSLLERERNHPDRLPVMLRWIEQLLGDENLPPLLSSMHRLQLAAAGGHPESILHAADALLTQAYSSAGANLNRTVEDGQLPDAVYRHFFAPIELGKAMNTDINAAYRRKLEQGHDGEMRELAAALALGLKAQALKRQEHWSEAATCAAAIPAGRFLSVSPHPILVEAALRQGNGRGVREACEAWLAENPLDSRVWEETVSRLIAAGETEYLAGYLGKICELAGVCLRDGVPPALADLARQYGPAPNIGRDG